MVKMSQKRWNPQDYPLLYLQSPAEWKECIVMEEHIIMFSEYGDPSGCPVFFFHGFPGSRYEGRFFHELGKQYHLRIISPDRPGMGNSTYQSQRTLLDWPHDIQKMVDQLHLSQYALLGVSGGGPYALACAARLPPSQLKGCIVMSGMGPLEAGVNGVDPIIKQAIWLDAHCPRLIPLLLWLVFGRKFRTKELAYRNSKKSFSFLLPKDRACFQDPRTIEVMAMDNYGAFLQGSAGVGRDGVLYLHDWEFKLQEIPDRIPVIIYHGTADNVVPVHMGQYVARAIPHSHYTEWPDEGHFSTIFINFTQLATELMNFFK